MRTGCWLALAGALVACASEPEGPRAGDEVTVTGGGAAADGFSDSGERDGAVTPGTSGRSSDGGTDPVPMGIAGADAAGSPAQAGKSLRQICMDYVRASCHRQLECRHTGVAPAGWDDSCSHLYASCPDLLFAEGTRRTVDEVLACTEAWKIFDCEDVKLYRLPACDLPGTFDSGEPCISRHQCATGACVAGEPGVPCSQCARILDPGAACDVYGACPDAQRCDNGTCRDVEPLSGLPAKAVGERCFDDLDYCPEGAECLVSPDEPFVSTCQVLPGVGAACAPRVTNDREPVCAAELYCNRASVCAALPAVGEPCGVTVADRRRCALGSVCDADSIGDTGTCIALLADVGERCAANARVSEILCRDGLTCDFDASAVNNEGLCVEERLEGEGCQESGQRCERNTECQDGVCTAPESLGLFEMLCR